jgi:hypothetical protein
MHRLWSLHQIKPPLAAHMCTQLHAMHRLWSLHQIKLPLAAHMCTPLALWYLKPCAHVYTNSLSIIRYDMWSVVRSVQVAASKAPSHPQVRASPPPHM